MADRLGGAYNDINLGKVPNRYVDQGDGTWALKSVVVNPDGSPITAGASANVAKATAAPPVYGEGSNVQLSVDLGGVLRTTAGGGGGAVDVTDRAPRLVGVVYGSQGQQLKQTATNFNEAVEIHVGASAVDPRSIRTLTSSDVVDVSDRVGRLVGHVTVDNAFLAVTGTFWQATQPVSLAAAVDVSDRAARLVGVIYGSQAAQLKQTATNFNAQAELAVGGTLIDPRSIRTLTSADNVTVANASLAVTGTFWQATQPVSIAAAVDVSDRAARLLGVVYGSQGQQLKQTATNFNAQTEIAVGGTLIDPRSIRTLTTADSVNIGAFGGSAVTLKALPTNAVGLAPIPVWANAMQLATYTVIVDNVATAALVANTRKDYLSIEHSATSTKTVKIRRIMIGGFQTTALVGSVYAKVFYGTAASSAGTAITPSPMNPATPAVDAQLACKSLPTIVAATLKYTYAIGALNAATAQTGFPSIVVYDWQEGGETQPLTLRAGVLEAFVVAIYSNVAHNLTLQVTVTFTEE